MTHAHSQSTKHTYIPIYVYYIPHPHLHHKALATVVDQNKSLLRIILKAMVQDIPVLGEAIRISSSKQPRQTNRIFPATKCSSQDHLDNASTRFHGSTKGPAVLGQSLRQLPAFVVRHGCEQSVSSIEVVPQKHLTLKSIQADMSILDHFGHVTCRASQKFPKNTVTLQGINISHLGEVRKFIFKSAILGGYVRSLEGISPRNFAPWTWR